MICRHIRKNENYNLVISSDSATIDVTYYKIGELPNFVELLGDIVKVDEELYIKTINFSELGEYIIKVKGTDSLDYERFKVYEISEEETIESKVDNAILLIENIKSELNEDLLYIKKMVKLINAQL